MTRWQRNRKTVALVSAALLVAALVLSRTGIARPYMSGSKSSFIFIGSNITPPSPPPGDKPTPAAPAPAGPAPTAQPSEPARPGE